jgi:hypothetical protein
VANNLTTTLANKIIDHLNLTASYTPTSPLKLALVTVLGSAATAGTEVTGGSYSRQTIAFSAASAEVAVSSGTVTFTGMPAGTVVGMEIWDSAGTPVRLWWGPVAASRTFTAGDNAIFAAGQVSVSLS